MRRLSPVLLLALFLLGFASSFVPAEEANTGTKPGTDPLSKYDVPLDLGSEDGTLELSLEKAIELAVKNNLGVEGYRYAIKSAKEEIEIEDSAFDQVFFAEIPISRVKTTASSSDVYATNVAYSVGIGQRFRTGTYLSLQLTDDYTKYNYPSDRDKGTVLLALSQPLYRNFGRTVNTASLEIARINHEVSRLELESEINSLIYDVTEAYWNLALARDRLDVAVQAKELAKSLYKTTANMVRSGSVTQLDLLRAESGVASREESIHLANLAVRTYQDNLKRLLNLNRNGSIPATKVILVDKPTRQEFACEFDNSINHALSNRAELRSARASLASLKIALEVAKNQLKPRIDLTAAIALTGLDEDYGEHWEEMLKGDYYTFQIGFDIEIPLGNRSAKASLRKAEHNFNRVKTQILTAEQGVIFEVTNAVRTLRTNFKRIQSAEVAATLAKKSLDEEEARYRYGKSTPDDVLKYQTELTSAQYSLLSAIVDFNLAIAELYKVKGINLANNHIDLEETLEPTMEVPEWKTDDSFTPLFK